jgi:hypothetical protein
MLILILGKVRKNLRSGAKNVEKILFFIFDFKYLLSKMGISLAKFHFFLFAFAKKVDIHWFREKVGDAPKGDSRLRLR